MLARTPSFVSVIGLISISITLPLLGTGCVTRDNATVSTSSMPVTTATQAPQVQIVQAEKESTFADVVPKWKTVSNGQVVYYCFDYADRDGQVHRCELPKAMTEGKWKQSAWECTFQAYTVHSEAAPQTVARKVEHVDVSDFPFVSPPSCGLASSQMQLPQTQYNLPQQSDYNQPIAPGMESQRQIDTYAAVGSTVRTVGQTDEQWQATQQAGADARQRLRENGDNRF